MSRQPYVYTMPESFLKDKSVPARWRVLGVINGFILNRGCFYGSNDWLMEQLSCTEPTISAAFAELEKLNLVEIRRTARSRKVYRKENDPNQLGSETQTEPAHDPNQLGPNSVSNSVKEYSALEDEQRVEIVSLKEEEAERAPKSGAKYLHAKEVFSWFPRPQASWMSLKNIQEREYAEFLWDRGEGAVKRMLRHVESWEGNEDFKYVVTKPSDLEKKWEDLRKYGKRNS